MSLNYTHFSVHCGGCGHNSRPAPSPREGIRRVLSGEFASCVSCNAIFVNVRVPKRPLVEAVARTLSSLHASIELVEYSGKPPRALGFVRVS